MSMELISTGNSFVSPFFKASNIIIIKIISLSFRVYILGALKYIYIVHARYNNNNAKLCMAIIYVSIYTCLFPLPLSNYCISSYEVLA